jgi:hypothetical protein
MIFVYPAAISDNVDKRYLPGLIKTLELYYLHHIAESVANGSIRFYITQNRFTGHFSDIKMECIDWDIDALGTPDTLIERSDLLLKECLERQNATILTEQDDPVIKSLETSIQGLTTLVSDYRNRLNMAAQNVTDAERRLSTGIRNGVSKDEAEDLRDAVRDAEREQIRISHILDDYSRRLEKEQSDLAKAIARHDQEEKKKSEEDKRDKREEERDRRETPPIAGGIGRMEIDKASMSLDLRPTSITVEANVVVYEKTSVFSIVPKTKIDKRSIPIGVKIVPIRIKNMQNVYDVMSKDMYTNSFSSFYKSSVRSMTATLFNWFNPVLRIFLRTFTKPEDFDIWKDVLLKRKGLINASSISSGDRYPTHQKYAASILVFSVNDINRKDMNFLGDASKVSQLQRLGWNSFAIMDDPDQVLMFCSYFENGMCSKIPYTYLFASLKQTDLFKELDSLSKFTNRVIGNFKARPIQVVESLRYSCQLKEKQNKIFNKYLELANKHGSHRDKQR